MATNIVSDDEQSDDEQSEASNHPDNKDWNTGWNLENNEDSEGAPRTVTFDLSPNDGAVGILCSVTETSDWIPFRAIDLKL